MNRFDSIMAFFYADMDDDDTAVFREFETALSAVAGGAYGLPKDGVDGTGECAKYPGPELMAFARAFTEWWKNSIKDIDNGIADWGFMADFEG